MMGLVQKLGGLYEKQKEVIHQMTDQIIAGETGGNNHEKEESERKLAELTSQLETTQVWMECMQSHGWYERLGFILISFSLLS